MHEREREWMLTELARRDVGESGAPLRDADEATIRSLQAELATLVDQLRQPPPIDDFAEESDCRRATEMVERLADPPERLADRAAPQRIGPYEVLTKLPQGGMGMVYQAVHTKLKRVVAIKILPTRACLKLM
jgi:serine/threonine protein kinase